ncbi:hypothetical protein ACH3XX_00750 [Streptomyces scabiei]|uniref:hypothetical protein n=1 Tax=Streptomyces scabiei TaxID=1930 RepID=UPI00378C4C41
MEPNMPQRRTPKDRDRRAALAAQAADIWPDPPAPPPAADQDATRLADAEPLATEEEAE